MTKEGKSIDISNSDMYRAIDFDANTSVVKVNGMDILVLGMDYENQRGRIDQFVTEIASCNELGFIIIHSKFCQPTLKQLPLGRYFTFLSSFISYNLSNYEYSENVNLFFEACIELGLQYEQLTGDPFYQYDYCDKLEAELFNDLIMLIRTASQGKDFKDKSYSRVYNASRNFRDTKIYIDRLFNCRSRLLVIRLDFGYRKEYVLELTVGDAQKNLKHFFNNMRSNKLFSPLRGYIWRRECGAEKGLHFHVVLFYDGSLAEKDEYIASQIGKYWVNQITKGQGVYFNCNLDKMNRYKRIGIGMIHHADVQKREYLLEAVKYLTKKELFFRPKDGGNFRAFGKGNMPSERIGGPGRPRTVGIPVSNSDCGESETLANN